MSETVLITGATTGIGFELAKLFAEKKYDLVITARSESKLKEISEQFKVTYKINVKIIAKDLSIPDSAIEIFNELKDENISPGILINNAGFGDHGPFSATDLKNDLNMINLNMTSLIILCRLFLDDMLGKNFGKIMNVASTAAFQPGPFMALYYATKAFVLSFSEALSEETSGTNVSVTCLCPGPTYTEFQNRAGINDTKMMNSKFSTAMSAEEVAKIGFEAMMKGKRTEIPGFTNKLFAFSVRLVPRKLVSKIIRMVHG